MAHFVCKTVSVAHFVCKIVSVVEDKIVMRDEMENVV